MKNSHFSYDCLVLWCQGNYLPSCIYRTDHKSLMSRESCDIYCNTKKKKENHDCPLAQWQLPVIIFRASYMTQSPLSPNELVSVSTCSRFSPRKAARHSGNALESHCLGFRSCHTNWLALEKRPGWGGRGWMTLHPSTLCNNIKVPESCGSEPLF